MKSAFRSLRKHIRYWSAAAADTDAPNSKVKRPTFALCSNVLFLKGPEKFFKIWYKIIPTRSNHYRAYSFDIMMHERHNWFSYKYYGIDVDDHVYSIMRLLPSSTLVSDWIRFCTYYHDLSPPKSRKSHQRYINQLKTQLIQLQLFPDTWKIILVYCTHIPDLLLFDHPFLI